VSTTGAYENGAGIYGHRRKSLADVDYIRFIILNNFQFYIAFFMWDFVKIA
jgi:hypothetical protein